MSGGHPPLAVSWLNLASADPINDKEPYGPDEAAQGRRQRITATCHPLTWSHRGEWAQALVSLVHNRAQGTSCQGTSAKL